MGFSAILRAGLQSKLADMGLVSLTYLTQPTKTHSFDFILFLTANNINLLSKTAYGKNY